jgi:hypothetical protein
MMNNVVNLQAKRLSKMILEAPICIVLTLLLASASSARNPRGSVPATSAGQATLTWVAPTTNADGSSPVTPLSGFTIYYGTSPTNLNKTIAINNAAATVYTVGGLASGVWYFAVAANAVNGNQSAQSNVASKTL